ncbi:Imm1 family immunity protein [Kitasatospora sp. NPDC088548]|uniref:Imm1 family immunity protein n=1 Tax=Kitasatospora sp. NPDC088548 TaxID=3364075 RepID=UPI0038136C98
MILEIQCGDDRFRPQKDEYGERLISSLIDRLTPPSPRHPGDELWFSMRDEDSGQAVSFLRVAVNNATGYGALIWSPNGTAWKTGGIYDSVWISNADKAPDGDPELVSDPGYPLYHDPASAIPKSLAREAISEYFDSGTGERPECISWTRGEMNGQRADRPPIVQDVTDLEPDWDSFGK